MARRLPFAPLAPFAPALPRAPHPSAGAGLASSFPAGCVPAGKWKVESSESPWGRARLPWLVQRDSAKIGVAPRPLDDGG